MANAAAKHYDALASQAPLDKKSRRQLPTWPIRECNNAIKRLVLGASVPQGSVVADVCCGRGGDLDKYSAIKPRSVHFFDISANSVDEAARRFRTGSHEYAATFDTVDCFSPAFEELLDTRFTQKFDAVICHFALHYAFESTEKIAKFLQVMNFHLRLGGVLLCAIPDYDVIMRRAQGGGTFGNGYYRVVFSGRNSYRFSLDDAVMDCEEYLVPPADLKAVLQTNGFEETDHANFSAYAASLGGKWPKDAPLADVCSLYAMVRAVKRHETGNMRELQLRNPSYCIHPGDVWTCTAAIIDEAGQISTGTSLRSSTKREACENAARALVPVIGRVFVDCTTTSFIDQRDVTQHSGYNFVFVRNGGTLNLAEPNAIEMTVPRIDGEEDMVASFLFREVLLHTAVHGERVIIVSTNAFLGHLIYMCENCVRVRSVEEFAKEISKH